MLRRATLAGLGLGLLLTAQQALAKGDPEMIISGPGMPKPARIGTSDLRAAGDWFASEARATSPSGPGYLVELSFSAQGRRIGVSRYAYYPARSAMKSLDESDGAWYSILPGLQRLLTAAVGWHAEPDGARGTPWPATAVAAAALLLATILVRRGRIGRAGPVPAP